MESLVEQGLVVMSPSGDKYFATRVFQVWLYDACAAFVSLISPAQYIM